MNEEKGELIETIFLAKWETRFWAWLIDILLVEVLLSFITNSSGFFCDFEFISIASFGISGVLMFAYWTLLEGYNGQSIGKMALGLKVTDRNGRKIEFGVAALESCGKAFILPLDCLIGWLAMPNSKLRLFNRISDTIVIKTNYEDPEGVRYVKEKE
ncbi:putative membrane protein YckC, RDD family [Candidatus Methanophagaceae archaeon]|nr:putative membrane protein YckC, RDD family [Methanophagales archaeon]